MFFDMRSVVIALVLLPLGSATVSAEVVRDIYVSFAGFGESGAAMTTEQTFQTGQSGSAFVWVDGGTDIDTGAFLDIASSDAGVIRWTGAEVFNPDIVVDGTTVRVDTRWGVVGPGTIGDETIDELRAFGVIEGTGIRSDQTGGSGGMLRDTLYDPASDAFLFARLDFDVLSPGQTVITLSEGDGLIVDEGVRVDPTFGSATVTAVAVPEPSMLGAAGLGLMGWVVRRRGRGAGRS